MYSHTFPGSGNYGGSSSLLPMERVCKLSSVRITQKGRGKEAKQKFKKGKAYGVCMNFRIPFSIFT